MARAGRIFWSRIKIAVDVGETFPIFVFFKNISVIIKKKKVMHMKFTLQQLEWRLQIL